MLNLQLFNFICRAAVLLLLLPIHEYAHARVSYALGDPTAADMGRLNFNPMVHLDLAGSVLLLIAGVGWAKPVPVDPRNFRHPKRDMILTAFAGPLANLILALFFLVLAQLAAVFYLRSGYAQSYFYLVLFLETVSRISVSLAVFNLLPIPPLDGSSVLDAVLPPAGMQFLYRYGNAINAAFLLLLLFTDIFQGIIGFFSNYILDFFYLITDFLPRMFL